MDLCCDHDISGWQRRDVGIRVVDEIRQRLWRRESDRADDTFCVAIPLILAVRAERIAGFAEFGVVYKVPYHSFPEVSSVQD